MWCPTCKADVAAEVSPDTGSVRCASCGMELAEAQAIRERTRDAREILERWSSRSLLDPFGPLPGNRSRQTAAKQSAAAAQPSPAEPPKTDARPAAPDQSAAAATSGRTFRIDAPGSVADITATGSSRARGKGKPVLRYADPGHGKQLAGPHFPVAPARQPGWAIAAGQWLAYIGVLALTVGTAVVVYGHFGGYSNYTPTGWLITTVGQMLLFLGVINLVSGGMEQSNDEVSQRIEILGEQLLRIEAAADQALRGPRIPAERYAEGETSTAVSTRDGVTSE